MNRLMISGVIGLALLCVLCPWCRAPAIEEQVRGAAVDCAEKVGLDPTVATVSGRDVTLAGAVSSEAFSHHLTSCIAAYPGTRSINNQLEAHCLLPWTEGEWRRLSLLTSGWRDWSAHIPYARISVFSRLVISGCSFV